jgi:hypothetical protein
MRGTSYAQSPTPAHSCKPSRIASATICLNLSAWSASLSGLLVAGWTTGGRWNGSRRLWPRRAAVERGQNGDERNGAAHGVDVFSENRTGCNGRAFAFS